MTNLSPNHLDRHGTMDAYARAKQNIFRFQNESGVLILNSADESLTGWADLAPGRVEFFDPLGELVAQIADRAAHGGDGAGAGRCAATRCDCPFPRQT